MGSRVSQSRYGTFSFPFPDNRTSNFRKGPEELPTASNSIRGLFLEVLVEEEDDEEEDTGEEEDVVLQEEDEDELREVFEDGEEEEVFASRALEREDVRHVSMSLWPS